MPARKRLDALNCSLAQALDSVGDWWTLLIVRDLLLGAGRFGELQASLDIARNILAARLKQLERGGLIRREGPPRRPRYALTDKGLDLFPALVALMQWGDRWAAPKGAPMIVEDGGGKRAAAMTVRTAGGRKIEPARARFRPGPGATARTRAFMAALSRAGD
jgi:DNA-binding HxlR family transcriptional regulator